MSLYVKNDPIAAKPIRPPIMDKNHVYPLAVNQRLDNVRQNFVTDLLHVLARNMNVHPPQTCAMV